MVPETRRKAASVMFLITFPKNKQGFLPESNTVAAWLKLRLVAQSMRSADIARRAMELRKAIRAAAEPLPIKKIPRREPCYSGTAGYSVGLYQLYSALSEDLDQVSHQNGGLKINQLITVN
jgi:hypothetical protein